MSLRRYRCHKEVLASKIKAIRDLGRDEYVLSFEDSDVSITVSHEYIAKHTPQPGGYFVSYSDGYYSFSPAKAFEEGYAEVK